TSLPLIGRPIVFPDAQVDQPEGLVGPLAQRTVARGILRRKVIVAATACIRGGIAPGQAVAGFRLCLVQLTRIEGCEGPRVDAGARMSIYVVQCIARVGRADRLSAPVGRRLDRDSGDPVWCLAGAIGMVVVGVEVPLIIQSKAGLLTRWNARRYRAKNSTELPVVIPSIA